ncbi:ankyrin repeat domain-containing protein [Sphingobacterium sp. lm-10]|uniref:ankyrin repeat domain-containing protein n=1 Tax=Sphingobacterium sp. lm-10 TaxID=2944904 RepID=UPI0020221B87|nr:ankyrin repeat domain-containing protein [Sphingobacterium sp. lm-10]MCL7987325.1 ankyrin repeat domain-containing protein [Sphingobacterium sp. lm-10]
MTKYIWLIVVLFALAKQTSAQQEILFQAIQNNDTTKVKEYVTSGSSVDIVDARGYTPTILAAYHGNLRMLKLLLDHGANANRLDKMGNTALMGAAFKGYVDIAALLLAQGADVNQQNQNDATALIFAATFGQQKMVKVLLDAGADPLINDRFGKTALDHALLQQNNEIYQLLKTVGTPKKKENNGLVIN